MINKIRTNPVDGAEVAWIEEEEFEMGSQYEQLIHTVHVDGFWIHSRQVSNTQYRLYCVHNKRVKSTYTNVECDMSALVTLNVEFQRRRSRALERFPKPDHPGHNRQTNLECH